MVYGFSKRNASLRMLWNLVRKRAQLSNAFLVTMKTGLVMDRKSNKSEMQTASYCFSLHFPWGD